MAELNNVKIFKVGTWKGFKFVLDDLKEIASTSMRMLKEKLIGPMLKLGHSKKQIIQGQTDGQPSLGDVTNFRTDGEWLVADFKNVPDVVFKALKKRLYKQISIELDFEKFTGWFVSAVSLLGADIPAVKTLPDLEAYLSDSSTFKINDLDSQYEDSSDLEISLVFNEPYFLNVPNEGDIMAGENDNKNTSQQDTKVVETVFKDNQDLRDTLKNKDTELSTATSTIKSQDEELKKLRAREAERSFADQKEKVLAPYRDDAKAGKLTPAIVDKIEKHLDEQKAVFSGDSTLSISPELTREIGEGYSKNLSEGEKSMDDNQEPGNEGLSPDVKLENAIAEVRAKTGVNYSEAEQLVSDSRPDLWKEYVKWTADVSDGRI